MNITTLILLAIQALASAATTAVTCQDVTTQFIENPYFEDGLTGWSIEYSGEYDVYHSSSGPGGDSAYVLALNGDHLNDNILSQEVSGLSSGVTYTLSMWWQLYAEGTGSCTMSAIFDDINLGSQTIPSTSGSAWKQFTATHSANDDDGDLEIQIVCSSGSFSEESEVNFANIIITGPVEVCTTATLTPTSTPTPTPTPTPTSSMVVSTSISANSAASSSSLAKPASSSPIIPLASSSAVASVRPVTTPASSMPATFSSAIIPVSSRSVAIASSSKPASSSSTRRRRPIRTRLPCSSGASHPASANSIRFSSATPLKSSSVASGSSIPSSVPVVKPKSAQTEESSSTSSPSVTSPVQPLQPQTTGPASQLEPTTASGQFTTSTIVTTQVRTITSCAASVTDCPARDRSTFLTTETVVVGTTICPVTATETGVGAGGNIATMTAPPAQASSLQMTTSTVFTTQLRTVTACPEWVTDCPASEKTSYVTTETVEVYTTICPVTATETGAGATETAASSPAPTGQTSSLPMTTSTVFTTQLRTVTACPASVTDCPASEKTTYVTTETVEAYTTVCPVTAAETGSSAVQTSLVSGNESPSFTLPTVQVYSVAATDAAGVPPTYLSTVTISVDSASSSTTVNTAVPAVVSSTHSVSGYDSTPLQSSPLVGAASSSIAVSNVTPVAVSPAQSVSASGYMSSTFKSSSPVTAGTATGTEAAGAIYTGGSISLRVEIMSAFVGLMMALVL
ncbi:hypothetical protein N7454_006004 [Penicillium verhagenii]|nr:hypothetical protein N7454_006004 [Penicillium verhagenii]